MEEKKKKLILFLCTGNTCRSPMAAGYLKKLFDDRGITDFEVRSAGVMTITGLLATTETIQIMDSVGVDLRKHRSRPLTEDLIRKADLVLGMTSFHTQSALRMLPEARSKIMLMKEFTGSDPKRSHIADPMGCTLEVYKKVFNDIRNCCNKMVKMDSILGVKIKDASTKKTQRAASKKKKSAKKAKKPAATRKKAKKAATKSKKPAVKTTKKTAPKTKKKSTASGKSSKKTGSKKSTAAKKTKNKTAASKKR